MKEHTNGGEARPLRCVHQTGKTNTMMTTLTAVVAIMAAIALVGLSGALSAQALAAASSSFGSRYGLLYGAPQARQWRQVNHRQRRRASFGSARDDALVAAFAVESSIASGRAHVDARSATTLFVSAGRGNAVASSSSLSLSSSSSSSSSLSLSSSLQSASSSSYIDIVDDDVDPWLASTASETLVLQPNSPPTQIFLPDSTETSNLSPPLDDSAMESTYDALARRCVDMYLKRKESLSSSSSSLSHKNGQLFIGIGGGPGSGKSTLSAAVASRIDDLLGRVGAAVVLPMDGFHYSRRQLQEMADEERKDDEKEEEKKDDMEKRKGGGIKSNGGGKGWGSYDALLARRGSPWTFDAESCIEAFTNARINGSASLPIYCRVASDPVPNGVQFDEATSIVLLEGNYLLAWDDERWAPLRERKVFDETWYISCVTMDEQRERLIGRHLETWSEEKTNMWGEGRAGAAAKADANDVLNAKWIDAMSRHHADLIVESK